MIYVDQPMNTGFSYGEEVNSMTESNDMFMDWISLMWSVYPAFNEKPLLMTGEGYAGKFVARYSYAILDANTKEPITKYNLTASMIGNPFISPLT